MFYAVNAAHEGLSVVNLVAVLHPAWLGPGVANAARLLWLCENVWWVLLFTLLLLSPNPKSGLPEFSPEDLQRRSTKQRAYHAMFLGLAIAVAAILMKGRTDVALIVAFGGWGIAGMIDVIRTRAWWNVPPLAAHMIVAAAVPIHSVLLAAIGLAERWLANGLLKPSVLSVLRSTPTAAEYLERQEILRARGWPFTQPQRVYLLIAMHRWEEALRVLDGIPHDDTFPMEKSRACRARILLHLGAYEQVTETASDAANSGSVPWQCAVALAYVRLSEVDRALEIVQALKTRHDRAASEALGEIYHALGAHETALTHDEGLLRQMSGKAALPIADILMDLGEYNEARRFYETALRQSKFRRADDLRKLASCYRELHDVGAARAAKELAQQS